MKKIARGVQKKVYERCADVYLENAIKHDNLDMDKAKRKKDKLQNFIKESFKSLPVNSRILEIGSADGINALFIKSLGYDVTASDVSDTFLMLLIEKHVMWIVSGLILKVSIIWVKKDFIIILEKMN